MEDFNNKMDKECARLLSLDPSAATSDIDTFVAKYCTCIKEETRKVLRTLNIPDLDECLANYYCLDN